MAEKRTPGGSPTAEDRKKYAVLSDGRFPIWDRESALAALRLRGRGTTPDERRKIIAAAAKYAPNEAKSAALQDKSA
jgi:hypothetical protein